MYQKSLVLVVDMCGCPNRCKHCWIGHMPNIQMDKNSDVWIVDFFRPYFNKITYYSWLREPDFCNDYKERWEKDIRLSVNSKPERFELASFWRIVRDSEYVKFLKYVGVKKVQLTFFGMEELTDKYIGRKGAFQELLRATEILSEAWKIGNLKEDSPDELIRRILEEDTYALNLSKNISVQELVEKYGNRQSEKVFFLDDYKSYLLNCYLDDTLK